jgi:hypothetical protein
MTPELRLKLAGLMNVALPMALAVRLYSLGVPQKAVPRALLAVVISWAFSIMFTALVYNPAGIAAGYARGEDFPEARYDNNKIAIQFFFGWAYPSLAIFAAWMFRSLTAE